MSSRSPDAVEPVKLDYLDLSQLKEAEFSYNEFPSGKEWTELTDGIKEVFIVNVKECKSADDIKHTNKLLTYIFTKVKENKTFRLLFTYFVPGYAEYYFNNLEQFKEKIEYANVKVLNAIRDKFKSEEIHFENVGNLYEFTQSLMDLRREQGGVIKKSFENEIEKLYFMVFNENGNSHAVKTKIIKLVKLFNKENADKKYVANPEYLLHFLLSGYPQDSYKDINDWWKDDANNKNDISAIAFVEKGINLCASEISNKRLGEKLLFTSYERQKEIYDLIQDDPSIDSEIKKNLVKPQAGNVVAHVIKENESSDSPSSKYSEKNKQIYFKLKSLIVKKELCQHCLGKHKLSECTEKLSTDGFGELLDPGYIPAPYSKKRNVKQSSKSKKSKKTDSGNK